MKKSNIIVSVAGFIITALLLLSVSLPYFGCSDNSVLTDTTIIPPPPVGPTLIFSKTFGSNLSDLVTGVVQADDGGVVMCGFTIASAFGDNDIFIMKLSGSGEVLWSNLYGGSGNDQATYIEKTEGGGFIIGGHSTSFSGTNDPITIKLDASGNLQWSNYYRWWNDDLSNCVIQTSDGGYIMTGYSNSFGAGEYDIYSLKLDASGGIMWVRCYGGAANEFGNAIRPTPDAGYIIGGYTFSYGLKGEGYVLKLFGDGALNWSKTYGSAGVDNIKDLQNSSNGYVACGTSTSFSFGNEAGLVFNFDNGGFIYWTRTFEGNIAGINGFSKVRQNIDGSYILSGTMQNLAKNADDMLLMGLFGDGEFNYSKLIGGVGVDKGTCLTIKSDGGYLFAGTTHSFGAGSNDIYLLSLAGNGTGCLPDNPVTPVGGSPTLEIGEPATVYFNVNFFDTQPAAFNVASFNALANIQCIIVPVP